MIELGLVTPDHERKPRMLHNESHKFESAFVGVRIEPNESVTLRSLAGSELGIWVAHGEGRFSLPYEESRYRIPVRYSYDRYPANPNGSDYNAAALCSEDGRHLAIMPHLERDPAVELGLLSRGSGRGRGDPVDRGFRQRPPLDRG